VAKLTWNNNDNLPPKPWKSHVNFPSWPVERVGLFSAPATRVIGKSSDPASWFFTQVFGKPSSIPKDKVIWANIPKDKVIWENRGD
jgi:hypothetical protein